MGWRYQFFTISSITLGVFIIRFFIFPFHESPRFLLSKGNDKGAVEVVHKIAAFNRRSCDLTVESLYEQCKETPVVEEKSFSKRFIGEVSRLRLLFSSWRMARVTILVWVTWMFDYWGKTAILITSLSHRGIYRLRHCRCILAYNLTTEEQCDQRYSRTDIHRLLDHLHSRDRCRHSICVHGPCTYGWAKVDTRFLVHGHGDISLPLQCCQYTGESYRVQHVGVLLPEPFQCGSEQPYFALSTCPLKYNIIALRMDSRGVSHRNPGNCDRVGVVLWQPAWDFWTTDCCDPIQQ